MIRFVKLCGWLKSWFGFRKVAIQMTAIESKVDRLLIEKADSEKKLHAYMADMEKAKREVERAFQLNQKMNLALETALQEIENVKEITIPGLVAANRVLIARWESEIQVHAIRSAGIASAGEVHPE